MKDKEANRVSMLGHLWQTYGCSAGVWIGSLMSVSGYVITRVIVPVLVATLVALAIADTAIPVSMWYYTMAVYGAGIILGAVGDVVFIRITDGRYKLFVRAFFSKLMRSEISFFRGKQSGELGAIFRDHLDGTVNIVRLLRVELVPVVLTILLMGAVIGASSATAGLLFFLSIIIQAVLSFVSVSKNVGARRRTKEIYRKLSSLVGDMLKNAALVHVAFKFRAADQQVEMLAEDEARVFWRKHRIAVSTSFLANIITAVALIGVIALIISGAGSQGDMTYSLLVAIMFVVYAQVVAQGIGDVVQRFAEHWTGVKTTLELLASRAEIIVDDVERPDALLEGSVEFDQVRFVYEEQSAPVVALKSVSLVLEAGAHVAITGRNGNGKTTLVNIVAGLEKPVSGRVLLGSVDISALDRSVRYLSASMTLQGSPIVVGTVAENITFFNEDFDPDRFRAVVEITGLQSAFDGGDLRLDQEVGEAGALLSGGQRQRIGIARCLLRDCQIYLFDEATSALPEGEGLEMVERMLAFLAGRTVLFVTHTPSIAAVFPQELIVDGGEATLVLND
jgi:ATP-binding cassette, subfamily B (MDR/TAP), member 7